MAAEFVELESGIKTRALAELDAGIRGKASTFVFLPLGITGSSAADAQIDLGIRTRTDTVLPLGVRSLGGADLFLGIRGTLPGISGREGGSRGVLWSRPMPLRSTTEWPEYTAEKTLPLIYGRNIPIELIPEGKSSRRYVAADGAISNVVNLFADGQAAKEYVVTVGPDPAGETVTKIRLNQPVSPGTVLRAIVNGRVNTVTGALIENPADIIFDLLVNVAGADIEYSEFDRFRYECSVRGINVGGIFTNRSQTLAAAIEEVARSVGAVVAPSLTGYAMIYPR